MKHLILLLAVPCWLTAALPYDFGTTLRLPNGVEVLRVTHTENGVEQSYTVNVSLPLRGSTFQKITAWGSKYFVPGKNEINCTDPCNVRMPLHYGPPKLTVQRFDSAGNPVGQPGIVSIPQYIPPPLTNFTMPIEMVGFEGFQRIFRVNTRPTADLSGTERLYLRIHRPAYAGKAQLAVNGSIFADIKKSNVTLLGTHAKWNVNSLDFGQSVLEMTMLMPTDLVKPGPNDISFRFAKETRDQSGFRVLEMNFLEPDRDVTQVSVSESTVTVTSPAHGYTTGDDVRIEAYPGIAWRVNGVHRITVLGTNTFTFTIPETDGKQAGVKNYGGVKVAKLIVNTDDFVSEDVHSWTAPPGSNPANGASRWTANDLLAPERPGQTITASCSECHTVTGLDLKYFNYSNQSIIVRSMFHGLTEQQGKDIAAWIRNNPSSNPGRPYNPVYQPCPDAVVVDAYDWAGACSYKDVLPGSGGMIEELFGEAIEVADWSPTRDNAHPAQQRINFQMLDWNDWMPLLHPKDTYGTAANVSLPQLYWPTSSVQSAYTGIRNMLAGNCPGSGCASHIAANQNALRINISNMNGKFLVSGLTLVGNPNRCQGNPSDAECNTNVFTEANESSKRIYSVGLWSATKTFEVLHEFDGERYGKSSFWTRTQIDRNAWSNIFFQSSFNLMKAIAPNGTIPGMFDGTLRTEKIMSMIWYQYQAILNRDNNQKMDGQNMFNSISPIDWPYTAGYFKDLAGQGINLPLVAAQWLMLANQRYRNSFPDWESFGHGYYWQAVNLAVLTGGDTSLMWGDLPPEDRSAWRTAIVDTLWTKNTNILCGVEQNGTAPLFTMAHWNARGNQSATRMPIKTNIQIGTALQELPSMLWHMIVMGRAFGVNSTTLDQLTACAGNWIGPSGTLASAVNASQNSIALTAVPTGWTNDAFRVRIDSEDIDCTGRSGATLTGCTRGANATTAASHNSGATAQIQVRWSSARTAGTCGFQANNLDVNPSCYQTPVP